MRTKTIKTMLMVTACLFLASLMGTPVAAVEVKLSGQINRAIMWADDGDESDIFHVDNDNSSTRFRLTGEQAFEKVTVGVVWESQFESNSSNKVVIGQDDDGSATFTERKLEVWFGGNFGKFWIGQGSGAADGTSEVDLSGTGVIMYSGVVDTASAISFVDDDGNAVAAIGDTRDNFDGLGRTDRLRYDTPAFGGFSFSASVTNGDAWSIGGRWSQEFDGIGQLAAAVGFINAADRSDPSLTQIGASASWLHDSGINFTIAYGQQDIDDSDNEPVNYYGKLGYKWGIHALAIEYGQTSDLAQEDDDSSNYGLAYVTKPLTGVEFYGLLRSYSLDRDDEDTNTVNQFLVGTRVKF